MTDKSVCEFCGRPIQGEPTRKVRRRKERVFCSEFCFRLDFYKIPGMKYEDVMAMYRTQCVAVPGIDFKELAAMMPDTGNMPFPGPMPEGGTK
jgi:hypothetical protein